MIWQWWSGSPITSRCSISANASPTARLRKFCATPTLSRPIWARSAQLCRGPMALLELENVVAAYGNIRALKGLTLAVEEGEIVALLGANGAGKSTTLRVISGLMLPRSGTLHFAGRSIGGLSPGAIVKLGVAHVPEGRRVFPGLTVRENIILGGSNRERPARAELEADAERMFGIIPWPCTHHRAASLPGDQRYPPPGHGGAAGGAERPYGALGRGPRFRARNGPAGPT